MDETISIRQEDLFWREIDGAIVVLDGRTWEYLNLNSTGLLLWKQLADGASESDLVKQLVEIYGIDIEVAQSDVTAFLGTLAEKELLAT